MNYFFVIISICMLGCTATENKTDQTTLTKQYITVLGTAQDAGFPQIGCKKDCCNNFYSNKNNKQHVVALGLVDLTNKKKWLFEATPDITHQLATLEKKNLTTQTLIDGVFLTHAHIGHYTGLMFFGREALGASNTKVYAMPKMSHFLNKNAPWSQLVSLKNIALQPLKKDSTIALSKALKVTPFLVPHRDELSETVGYKIEGKHKSLLFIPDINKWQIWNKNIVNEVKKVDYALLDATFYKDGELKRPMSEIPHPFIEETVALFKNEAKATKNKVYFIHFNHTNPVLQPNSKESIQLKADGFNIAFEGLKLAL